MERIDRNGSQAESRPETVFLFDMHGGVFEVVCDRAGRRPEPPRREPEEGPSPSVIRRWLAGLGFGLVGLGLFVEPAAAVEPAPPPAVVSQSW